MASTLQEVFPSTRPPWKRIWKGPLSPRRVSPARSISDFIQRAMSGARLNGGDPISTGFQTVKRSLHVEGPGPAAPSQVHQQHQRMVAQGPRPVQRATQPAHFDTKDRIVRPRRRLVNPHLFLAAKVPPRISYRDALMAGGDLGRFRGQHAPDRAEPGRRRGRGRGSADARGRGRDTGHGHGRGGTQLGRGAGPQAHGHGRTAPKLAAQDHDEVNRAAVGAQRRADAFDGTDQVNQGAGRASVNNTFTEEAAG